MENFLRNPLPTTIEELEKQTALIEEERSRCSDAIRELMAREDIPNGIVFPREIHELHQRRNMLATHIQYRKVRINRLKMQNGMF